MLMSHVNVQSMELQVWPSEPPTLVPRGPGHSCPVRGANANANALTNALSKVKTGLVNAAKERKAETKELRENRTG